MSLSINNLCIGNIILKINSCSSTNIYAKNLLAKNEPIDGTVVITDKQSNGKGQIGNKWQSEYYKNLTFSVVVKPYFLEINMQFMLSKIVSLACIEVLNSYKKDSFKIKWPNDIYYKNKKIAGILIENILSTNKIKYSILGIGLNINQEKFTNLPFAISLQNIINKEINLEDILKKLLKKLDYYYLKLKKQEYIEIDKKYLENMLAFEKNIEFLELKSNTKFKAKIKGVNKLGQLHLEKDNKDLFYNFKELVFINSDNLLDY